MKSRGRVILASVLAVICSLFAINMARILNPPHLLSNDGEAGSVVGGGGAASGALSLSKCGALSLSKCGNVYVIVLGGGITHDAKLGLAARERVKAAAAFMNAHPVAAAVVTGGKGRFTPCAESEVMKSEMVAMGADASCIIEENQAHDTIQNLLYSAQMIAETEGTSVGEVLRSPVVLVTSDYHLSRAERIAKREGFTNITGIAARTPWAAVPRGYVREVLAWVKLDLRILLTGQPCRAADEAASKEAESGL